MQTMTVLIIRGSGGSFGFRFMKDLKNLLRHKRLRLSKLNKQLIRQSSVIGGVSKTLEKAVEALEREIVQIEKEIKKGG